MYDAVDGRVAPEDFFQGRLVGDVDLVKRRSSAAKQLDPINGNDGRIKKIVHDDNIIAVF